MCDRPINMIDINMTNQHQHVLYCFLIVIVQCMVILTLGYYCYCCPVNNVLIIFILSISKVSFVNMYIVICT